MPKFSELPEKSPATIIAIREILGIDVQVEVATTQATLAQDAALAASNSAAAAAASEGNAATSATAAGDAATSAGNSATTAASLVAGTVLLRHGTGAPDNALGIDGDYYIDDTAPKTLYGPKAAGAWPAGVSLKGETGDTGSNAVWTQITQAAYDALSPPDDATLYVIVG